MIKYYIQNAIYKKNKDYMLYTLTELELWVKLLHKPVCRV